MLSARALIYGLGHKVVGSVPAFQGIHGDPGDEKQFRNEQQLFEVVGMHHHDQ